MKRRTLIALLAAVPAAGVPRWPSAAVSIDGLRLAWDYSRARASDSTVVVWQFGQQVFSGGDADKVYAVASISKTLTSIVVHTGGFPLDTLVHTLLPDEWVGEDEGKRQITIHHLLTMTSGLEPHDQPTISGYLEIMFDQPTVADAGTRWAYASLPVDLLGAALQEQTGMAVKQLFDSRVARKIGVPDGHMVEQPHSLHAGLVRRAHVGAQFGSGWADASQSRAARIWRGNDHQPAFQPDLARLLPRFSRVPTNAWLAVQNPAERDLAAVVLAAPLEQPRQDSGPERADERLLRLGIARAVPGDIPDREARGRTAGCRTDL
jgi:CubicO group peptidase (beta-lactamase class C family)